jgi:ectoine hydroxylase-related dioxygenase (phytanoyl-CoA dioxygenase family)
MNEALKSAVPHASMARQRAGTGAVAMTLKGYGIGKIVAASDGALALEEIARNGFTVLADAIPPDNLPPLRNALDRLLTVQTSRFGGAERLAEIGDAGQARALLEEEPIFLELLCLPALDAIVETLLGPAALVMQQNGIAMPPMSAIHHQQSWHRDLPYQEWTATKPIALGSLSVLDDFTPESGGTRFLPGSHLHAHFPSADYVTRWAVQPSVAAGSVIVFDAMLFHAGGVNHGTGPRRAVNTLFGIPLLAQQVIFTPKPGMDTKLRRRLGLDYQPKSSVDAWRIARYARMCGGNS